MMKIKNNMLKNLKPKVLTVCISALSTGMVLSSVAQASDIDVYQTAKEGDITLMFMLDISGSMGAPQLIGNSSACDIPSITSVDSNSSVTSTNGSPSYTRYFCTSKADVYFYQSRGTGSSLKYYKCGTGGVASATTANCAIEITALPDEVRDMTTNTSGTTTSYYKKRQSDRYYDRITRLKDGMFDLLNGNTTKGIVKLDDAKVIGLSTYSRPTSFDNLGRPSAADNTRGQVRIPARSLGTTVNGVTQRQILLNEIAVLGARGGTPTAHAYAETAAYLFGTRTGARTASAILGRTTTSNTNRFFECTEKTVVGGCNAYSSNYTTLPSYDYRTNSNSYYYYYKNDAADSDAGNSGFPYSYADTKITGGALYGSPSSLTQTDAAKQCSGQGIYVLTDGEPSSNSSAESLMRTALGTKSSTLDACTSSDTSWDCMHKFAGNLLDAAKNPLGLKIKTAVVGFGNTFNNVTSFDKQKTQAENLAALGTIDWNEGKDNVKKAAYWGIVGEGGWYSGNSSEDIVKSVNSFLGDLGGAVPSVTTGSPTIARDALNPSVLQKEAYFPQFNPTPDKTYQLWSGNLKKYNVVAGVLKDSNEKPIVDDKGQIKDNYDLWAKAVTAANKDADENTPGSTKFALIGGAKSQLELRATGTTDNRKLLTNRIVSGSGSSAKFVTSANLRQVKISDLTTDYQYDVNRGYLFSLLGYNVDAENPNTITSNSLASASELRQVGAVMHSSPILLTNTGTITYKGNVLASKDREDYIMFGTTQGLLHVVDAVTGKEKFAFVPNEMVENQKQAFLDYKTTSGGTANLFYGIDGPWTTYTEYVVDKVDEKTGDSTLTVGASRLNPGENGTQLAYGGLRMGGRSYYALDLTNIDDPKLKFQISPADQKVYYNGSSTSVPELAFMGQSWSKPTIAWVKWGKTRKRVMFVGGGYDAGYESDTYNQTDSKKGSGVYMFDADTGALLWWASANASATSAVTANTGVMSTKDNNLQYSVVSEIRAEDRNSDGLVDHLYFGDLGGQIFRIDLDNTATTLGTFAKAPQRLLNLHKTVTSGTGANIVTNGTSPRFYEMPAFSIYDKAGTTFAVISIGSGNRSNPLIDYTVNTNGQDYDAVYNIYDKDVTARDVFKSGYTYKTQTISLLTDLGEVTQENRNNDSTLVAPYTGKGWYFRFKSNKLQSAKVFATPRVLNSRMFVTTFDGSKPGLSGDCGAGVKGESFLNQFCMPFGQCTASSGGGGGGGGGEECTSGDGCSLGSGIQDTSIVDTNTECDPKTDPNQCQDRNKPKPDDPDNTNYCSIAGPRGAKVQGGVIPAGNSHVCLVPQRWFEYSNK